MSNPKPVKCDKCGSEDTHKANEYSFGVSKVLVYQCHKCGKKFKRFEL